MVCVIPAKAGIQIDLHNVARMKNLGAHSQDQSTAGLRYQKPKKKRMGPSGPHPLIKQRYRISKKLVVDL